jgi:hypothetical protein
MKEGDSVLVIADTEDQNSVGVIHGTRPIEIQIGARVYPFWVVQFADGHEGAYEERELQIVEPRHG